MMQGSLDYATVYDAEPCPSYSVYIAAVTATGGPELAMMGLALAS
jgi:hypothetical protein